MPDLTRIIDALVALVRAVPGCETANIAALDNHASISFACKTRDQAHALAEAFGLKLDYTQNHEKRWLRASGARVGTTSIMVFGPMEPLVECAPSEDAITAALAQAEEAVRE